MDHADSDNLRPPSQANEQGVFLCQLHRLVLDEAATVRQQIFQVWSKQVSARVAEGLAIEGVRIIPSSQTARSPWPATATARASARAMCYC
jgi:hypothetical protein